MGSREAASLQHQHRRGLNRAGGGGKPRRKTDHKRPELELKRTLPPVDGRVKRDGAAMPRCVWNHYLAASRRRMQTTSGEFAGVVEPRGPTWSAPIVLVRLGGERRAGVPKALQQTVARLAGIHSTAPVRQVANPAAQGSATWTSGSTRVLVPGPEYETPGIRINHRTPSASAC